MRFYVATRLENAAAARALAGELRRRGHHQTYDWTVHGSVRGDAGALVRVATAEVLGVLAAELFVALLPGGRGTHAELGIALAAGASADLASGARRLVILVGDHGGVGEGTCAFYHHSRVSRVATDEEALALVDTWSAAEEVPDVAEVTRRHGLVGERP